MYRQGNYQYNDDGTVSQITESSTTLNASNVIQPIDIQSHLQTTIQTHNAVSVATVTASNGTSWLDTDGFDKIAVTLLNDASTSSSLSIQWSSDGTTIQGYDLSIIPTGTGQQRSAITDTKMRYARIQIYNGDTAAHTMSAWAYLKS